MADNPDRLAQIMQRMQVSNQRSVGNRLGGANGANAPTPPSEQIDFTKNTLSPPSMAQPDDTGPGQQMPSVIQPPASGNVGMPSGGNAYSGNQQGVSPSTRDLYSLPDYSGGMGGGNSGGGFDVGRLLKMLSSYMGSQNGQPSPAPAPSPGGLTPDMQMISVSEGVTPGTYTPHEYTGDPSLLASNTQPMQNPGGLTASTMQYTPEQYARDQARRASGNLNERELMQKNNPEMYNSAMRIPQANDTPEQQEQYRRASEWYSSQQRPITNDPKSPNFNPNLNAYGEKGPDISLATNEFAALHNLGR